MRQLAKVLKTAAAAFGRDRGGNMGITFAVTVPMLAAAVGYGINLAQLHNAKSALSNALDAAITSTARDLTTGKVAAEDADDLIRTFLMANLGSGFATSENVTLDRVVVDKAARTVSAEASVDVALAFPVIGGQQSRTITGGSAAVYSDRTIEVAMMLDVTGSMAGNKLRDLKIAAKDAIENLLEGIDPRNPRVRVSIVPYSDAVNVGTSLASYVQYDTRYSNAEPPAYSDVHSVAIRSRVDTCATERRGSYQFSDASPYSAMPSRDARLAFCPTATLRPLTADARALTAAVDSFRADGFTAGHIGIQWTWYMLSQKWARVLPATAAPAAADPKKVQKIAILMTDGEFNTAFADVGSSANTRSQPVRSQDKAERLCARMKDAGIEVFTIGFMLDQASAKRTMSNCASPETGGKRYFEASNGAALKDAFAEIVRNIERLSLTK